MTAIKALVDLIDPFIRWMVWIFEIGRLFDVGIVSDCRVKICCLDIEIVCMKMASYANGEDSAYRGGFCDRGKSFCVVDARDFSKTTSNISSLVTWV